MNKILSTALMYADAGIPLFPCNEDKSPATARGFKDATVDETLIRQMFEKAPKIGVPMGSIVCLDVDAKHKDGLVADFEHACDVAGIGDLLLRLPKQLTPSGGGCHFLFRPVGEVRNTRLAKNANKETIIETRGKGGYICVAPSKGYSFERGGLLGVPQLTEEEQDALFQVARSFTEVATKEAFTYSSTPAAPWQEKPESATTKPGDAYNQSGDIAGLLQRHGWTTSNGTHWTRPGKSEGISATLGKVEGKFYVFTSNAAPFEPDTSYSPFACYALLECGGDFSEAGRRLDAEGYGDRIEVPELSDEWNEKINRMIENMARKSELAFAKMDEVADKAKPVAMPGEIIDDLGASFDAAMESMFADDDENLEEMKRQMRDAVFVFPDIAIQGQLTIINGAPNTGKTLLGVWLACNRDRIDGQIVIHINADDTFNGAVEKMMITKPYGVRSLVPGQRGFEVESFRDMVKTAIARGRAGDYVFLLDTLKKFCSMMSKDEAAKFGTLCRSFAQAGGTVIALAHTNKIKDAKGKSIAEGVGDFENDFDCAYTLELTSDKDAAIRTVCFENRKNRGPNARKVNFSYDGSDKKSWHHRFKSIAKVEDAQIARQNQEREIAEMYEDDAEVVQFLIEQLQALGEAPRSALTQNNLGVAGSGSRGRREKVLDRYGIKCPVEAFRFFGTKHGDKGGVNYFLLGEESRKEGNLVRFMG